MSKGTSKGANRSSNKDSQLEGEASLQDGRGPSRTQEGAGSPWPCFYPGCGKVFPQQQATFMHYQRSHAPNVLRQKAEQSLSSSEPTEGETDVDLRAQLRGLQLTHEVLTEALAVNRLKDGFTPAGKNGELAALRERVAQLEREKEHVEMQRRFDVMESRIASLQNNGGKAGLDATDLLKSFVEMMKIAQGQQPKPGEFLDSVEKYSKSMGNFTEPRLKARELELRTEMWKTEKELEREERLEAIRREMKTAEEGRSQFHEVADVLKTTITDAFKPVSSAIADGLRQRVAGGGAPPQAQAIDYGKLSPAEREAYGMQFRQIQGKLDAEVARLNAAAQALPPATVEPAPAPGAPPGAGP